jgi:hypothetical protein
VKLQAPFIQLPLLFDADALAREVLAIDESSWRPHPQAFPGNSMLPLVAVNGDPSNESFAGPMRPTPYLQACPCLRQVFASIGATIGRSRLMRLSGQAEVKPHIDQGYYWADRVRVHVPIVTQPTVRFECGGTTIHMAEGECWIFDTWREHCVVNDASQARIHLVVDTVGGGRFWELIASGRAHGAPHADDWRPQRVVPQAGLREEFPLESVNVPLVMSPWEMGTHLGFLLGEARPHPQLQRVQLLAGELVRGWRGLWAQYGERAEGRPHYRALIDAFSAQAMPLAKPLVLRNGGSFSLSLANLVVRSALGDETRRDNAEYGSADRG